METVICIPFNNSALDYAGRALSRRGITTAPLPCSDATHLLLPVPSFDGGGKIRGGGNLKELLNRLPDGVTIIGGNLRHPELADCRTVDLLSDPFYVAQNAAITAHCALKYILRDLPITLAHQKILVIGWGRIGKCLARLLRGLDAQVTICSRDPNHRSIASALGYATAEPGCDLSRYRVIVNTAPAAVLTESQIARCRPDCVKLDLASVEGIPGPSVIWARGLPGKDAPETSGNLIADSICRLTLGKEEGA